MRINSIFRFSVRCKRLPWTRKIPETYGVLSDMPYNSLSPQFTLDHGAAFSEIHFLYPLKQSSILM
jgi:hypothetical protein